MIRLVSPLQSTIARGSPSVRPGFRCSAASRITSPQGLAGRKKEKEKKTRSVLTIHVVSGPRDSNLGSPLSLSYTSKWSADEIKCSG